jgi:predicted RNA-binding Zn ribbon-like protein
MTTADTTPTRTAPGRLELVREFVNTLDVLPDEEQLVDPDALRRWLLDRKLIGAREQLAPGDLERAIAIREALRALLDEGGHGEGCADAVRALNAQAASLALHVAFDPSGAPALRPIGGGLDRALADLFAVIEHSAVEGTWQRLKVCADPACRWAFYDRSKNHSRSWCNMAVCGNRAKAREFRRRHRAAAASGD